MPHLTALIDSLKQQTYGNVEVLASVTPTEDGSESALEQTGIRVIRTPVGTSAAENWTNATELATGDYTKLICQDDLLYPQAIELQVKDLQNNPNAVMAIGQRDIIDSTGKVLFRGRGLSGLTGSSITGTQALKQSYLRGGNVFGEPLAVLFRTETLNYAMPWRDDNPLMLDLNTYSRVAPQGDIALRHESVGAFRVSATSWSTTIARHQLQQTKDWQHEYESANPTSVLDKGRALIGRHIQTNTRRAAYAYLGARKSL
jgi:glycosyltransferase involved in cell wall biosynthesis